MAERQPRGIRNHNPGNLRKTNDKWQGLAAEQNDLEFFTFEHAVYGIRALARTLITYQDKHNIHTIENLISRWAPPVENDTKAYAAAVADYANKDRHAWLDMHDYLNLRPIVEAITLHENGIMPYTDQQIDKGLALAGVEPERDTLAKSRTVNAGTVAAVGTAGTGVVEALQGAQDALSPLVSYLDIAKWAMLAVVLVSIGVMLYARWDDWKKLAR